MDSLIMLAIVGLLVASMWKIYAKAGVDGWKSIVPFYNTWVLVQIVNRPSWWFWVMLFVPFVNMVLYVMVINDLVKGFGKSTGFTVGVILLPFVFLPMLAFGKDNSFTKPVREQAAAAA